MAHEHGFFHGELHAENILVGQNDYIFYLIDVGHIKFRKRLPISWKIYDISKFFYSILNTCTDDEMRELANKYIRNTWIPNGKINFHERVLAEIYKIKRRHWRGTIKKCFRNSIWFKITRCDNYKIIMLKEWSKLKYQDPKIILLKLKELEIIASNYQIDMKVRNLRTNSLKCYREGREAAIFCYGMGKAVVHTPVYFAIVENADYDCVARCKYGFTPVQIKELVPEYLNPTKDLNQIIAELKKYPVSHNTVWGYSLD